MCKKWILIFVITIGVLISMNTTQAQPVKIGESYPSNRIIIEKQDYISEYITWQFKEINSTHWLVNFTVNQSLVNDVKYCFSLETVQKLSCFQDVYNNYFSKYDKTKLVQDIQKVKQFPLVNLTRKIKISKNEIDFTQGKGSFYLIFPSGFKPRERAKFGFGSTVIATTTVGGFTSHDRDICKDGSGILHVVWMNDSTTVFYANSTDGVNWNVNTSFVNDLNSEKFSPYISCNGNNITIVYQEGVIASERNLTIAISTDNGATWSWQQPVTGGVGGANVERRGSRIYIVYADATSGQGTKFLNSSDGGTTWGPVTEIIPVSSLTTGGVNLAVNGSGGTTDKIYVTAQKAEDGDIYFVNSTDSGETWGTAIKIIDVAGTGGRTSITFSGTDLYVVTEDTDGVYFTNSTDSGITWTTAYTLNTSISKNRETSVTIDNNGYPWVFWETNETNANYDIVYRKYNGTNWEDLIYITNENDGNRNPNTPYTYYSDYKIHFVYRNGTTSPYDIIYDFVTINTAPKWSNNATSVTSDSDYSPTQNYGFEVEWSDDNDANGYNFSYIEHNFTGTLTNYTTSRSNNVSYYNFTSIPVGTYVFRFYANDSSDEWNVTDQWVYTVNKNSTGVIIAFSLNDTYIHINESIRLNISAPFLDTLTVEIETTGGKANYTASYLSDDNYTLDLTKTQLGDTSDNATTINITNLYFGGNNYTTSSNTSTLNFEYALTQLALAEDPDVTTITPGTIINIYAYYNTTEGTDIENNCSFTIGSNEYDMIYDPTDGRHEKAVDTTGWADGVYTYSVTCSNASYQTQTGSGDFSVQAGGGGRGGGPSFVAYAHLGEYCDELIPCAQGLECEDNVCISELVLKPICGNEKCEEGESFLNCPEDCPTQSPWAAKGMFMIIAGSIGYIVFIGPKIEKKRKLEKRRRSRSH